MRSSMSKVSTVSGKTVIEMVKRRDGISRSRRGYFSD
jgi:hypothetical protein